MSGQSDNPIIVLADGLVQSAIERKASDIHLEPTSGGLRVRLRMDGMLTDYQMIDASIMLQVISRLKVLSHINIADRRVPHDGKFTVEQAGSVVDLRVSTFPCLYGEKMVIRILDRSHNNIALDALGMDDGMRAHFTDLIAKSHGFFLVTGPTGSGKTTTLYAALSHVNEPHKNIITLEDPIEYNVEGITQGQVNPDAGFSFSKGIRSILRQDPDILMVGEIRDTETARTAIEAALTGHLVLSTLHTNDAPGAIMRLIDMGIEPFLINAAVTGVLAQRLARKICSDCKELVASQQTDRAVFDRIGIDLDRVYKGVGCSACLGTGYKGRTGIFELLSISPAMRSLIMQKPCLDQLYAQARIDGMSTLHQDGVQKIRDGIITPHELIRSIF